VEVEVSWLGIAGAGALSFFSPCVLPIVLPYLCYMAGISVTDFRSMAKRKNFWGKKRYTLVTAAISFVLGFTSIFVMLGVGATKIGGFFLRWQQQMTCIAGVIIILNGLNFLGIVRLSFLSREARFQIRSMSIGPAGAFILGLAFAFGWTPCIGPILGLILALAASKETMIEGASLLAIYSLGLGVPFILTALFSDVFVHFLNRFRIHLNKMEKVIGILLITAGILFLNDQIQNISYWLLETFPTLEEIK